MMFRRVADDTPKPRFASQSDETGSPWSIYAWTTAPRIRLSRSGSSGWRDHGHLAIAAEDC